MKIRQDYVSNSSSSSYIVICMNSANDDTFRIKSKFSHDVQYLIPNKNGKHQFGWECEITSSFDGKMNFIGIQLLELLMIMMERTKDRKYAIYFNGDANAEFNRCHEMLKKVCKEKFGLEVVLDTDLLGIMFYDDFNGFSPKLSYDFYIDHQSSVIEGQCMKMFKDEETLYNFMKTKDSYIQGGNDNI